MEDAPSIAELDVADPVNLLLKNIPNPFNNITTIAYSLKNVSTEGEIRIYDVYGHLLKVHKITGASTEIEIDWSNEAPGMYFYSLIIDKTRIDTKSMILIR